MDEVLGADGPLERRIAGLVPGTVGDRPVVDLYLRGRAPAAPDAAANSSRPGWRPGVTGQVRRRVRGDHR
jgi:hypothetical protein